MLQVFRLLAIMRKNNFDKHTPPILIAVILLFSTIISQAQESPTDTLRKKQHEVFFGFKYEVTPGSSGTPFVIQYKTNWKKDWIIRLGINDVIFDNYKIRLDTAQSPKIDDSIVYVGNYRSTGFGINAGLEKRKILSNNMLLHVGMNLNFRTRFNKKRFNDNPTVDGFGYNEQWFLLDPGLALGLTYRLSNNVYFGFELIPYLTFGMRTFKTLNPNIPVNVRKSSNFHYDETLVPTEIIFQLSYRWDKK